MKDQLITFETAVLAKEKGFDIASTPKSYNRHKFLMDTDQAMFQIISPSFSFLAPTQSLLQRWLREVHDIDIAINRSMGPNHYKMYWFKILKSKVKEINSLDNFEFNVTYSDSYEKALELALVKSLNLI